MTREGEAWPTSPDREAELAESRGKEKSSRQKRQKRKEGRAGKKQMTGIGRGSVLPSCRPVVSVCYIIICRSGLNVKLGYWRGKKNVTVTSRIFTETKQAPSVGLQGPDLRQLEFRAEHSLENSPEPNDG